MPAIVLLCTGKKYYFLGPYHNDRTVRSISLYCSGRSVNEFLSKQSTAIQPCRTFRISLWFSRRAGRHPQSGRIEDLSGEGRREAAPNSAGGRALSIWGQESIWFVTVGCPEVALAS
jgi:hypothetical protein